MDSNLQLKLTNNVYINIFEYFKVLKVQTKQQYFQKQVIQNPSTYLTEELLVESYLTSINFYSTTVVKYYVHHCVCACVQESVAQRSHNVCLVAIDAISGHHTLQQFVMMWILFTFYSYHPVHFN